MLHRLIDPLIAGAKMSKSLKGLIHEGEVRRLQMPDVRAFREERMRAARQGVSKEA
jgi:hypothetical protein